MIAKGRSLIRAEIDFMYETYKSLLVRLQSSYKENFIMLEKNIQDIKCDVKIPSEEKRDIIRTFEDILDQTQLEERNTQILLFSCVYSFWEKALQTICEYHNIKILKRIGKQDIEDTINYSPRIQDYLTHLLDEEEISKLPVTLLKQYDELRNYSIHGTLPPKRKEILQKIERDNDIKLVEKDGNFILSSFEGLHKTLSIIYETLIFIIEGKQS